MPNFMALAFCRRVQLIGSRDASPSCFRALVGEIGLAQVELALDAAPRLVLELAVAEEIVDLLPLPFDEQQLDLVVQLAQPPMAVIAIAAVDDMLEAIMVVGAERPDEVRGQAALLGEPVETLDHRFDGPPPRLLLLDTILMALAAPGMGETQAADHPRQHQSLAHQRHQDHGEGEKEDEVAVGKRRSGGGGEGDRQRRRQRDDAAYAGESE